MLVLISVPIDGGHYLVDMIGGAVLAILVWVGLQKLHLYFVEESCFSMAGASSKLLLLGR